VSSPQSQAVAQIALELPEHPTAIDVLAALNKAYEFGCHDTAAQIAISLAITDGERERYWGKSS
jgi:hypothetical protein